MPAPLPRLRASGLVCWALALLALAADGKPHDHGVVRLDVSVDGAQLTIAVTAALDNWLGFERAPRTDAERKAAADVLARLRNPNQGTPLFAADAAAQCQLTKAEVSAPVLEPGTPPGAKPAAPAAPAPVKGSAEHADLEASFSFQCAQPAQLRTLDVGLFDAYKRIQRIDVQVAGLKGQSKVTLLRPARSVTLTR